MTERYWHHDIPAAGLASGQGRDSAMRSIGTSDLLGIYIKSWQSLLGNDNVCMLHCPDAAVCRGLSVLKLPAAVRSMQDTQFCNMH